MDWLFHDNDYGYTDFMATVDTTIMGYKTYAQILTFGEFPYKGKANYVLTAHPEGKKGDHVSFISSSIPEWAGQLKQDKGKDIWLVGGSEVIDIFLRNQLID